MQLLGETGINNRSNHCAHQRQAKHQHHHRRTRRRLTAPCLAVAGARSQPHLPTHIRGLLVALLKPIVACVLFEKRNANVQPIKNVSFRIHCIFLAKRAYSHSASCPLRMQVERQECDGLRHQSISESVRCAFIKGLAVASSFQIRSIATACHLNDASHGTGFSLRFILQRQPQRQRNQL